MIGDLVQGWLEQGKLSLVLARSFTYPAGDESVGVVEALNDLKMTRAFLLGVCGLILGFTIALAMAGEPMWWILGLIPLCMLVFSFTKDRPHIQRFESRIEELAEVLEAAAPRCDRDWRHMSWEELWARAQSILNEDALTILWREEHRPSDREAIKMAIATLGKHHQLLEFYGLTQGGWESHFANAKLRMPA